VIDPSLGPSLKLRQLLEVLERNAVDFIVIGGVAGMIHGSAVLTFDFDLLYARNGKNLERLAAAAAELHVTLRDAPPDLPFQSDARALAAGSNFAFESDVGPFDILGHADGMRIYETMRGDAVREELWGVEVRIASVDDLIRMKRAAGRPKDKAMVEELTALIEDQRRAAKGEKGRPS
jgi:predicted nucleotidyltransferase